MTAFLMVLAAIPITLVLADSYIRWECAWKDLKNE